MTPYEELEKVLTRIKNSYGQKSETVRAEDLCQVIDAQIFILDRLKQLTTRNLFK